MSSSVTFQIPTAAGINIPNNNNNQNDISNNNNNLIISHSPPVAASSSSLSMLFDVDRNLRVSRRGMSSLSDSRENSIKGTPGTRRFRRHLNNTLSDYDSEYETEASEEDIEQIVKIEWKATFSNAPQEFFDNPKLKPVKQASALSRTERRLLRLAKQKVAKVSQPHNHNDFNKKNNQLNQEQKQISPQESELEDPTDEEKEYIVIDHKKQNENINNNLNSTTDTNDSSSSDINRDEMIDYNQTQRMIPAQELASDLFLLIDKPRRTLLRKMYDFNFLTELEELLVNFKSGELTAEQAYSNRKHYRYCRIENPTYCAHLPSYTDLPPIVISIDDQFERYLGEAIIQFHCLQAVIEKQSNQIIIRKGRNFLRHAASLNKYIHSIQSRHEI